jgi:NADH-quinone oxidoreductase subunit A
VLVKIDLRGTRSIALLRFGVLRHARHGPVLADAHDARTSTRAPGRVPQNGEILVEGWLLLLLMIAAGAVVGIGGVIAGYLTGPRMPTAEKEAPYECGMPAVGDARERQSVKFYLVAMIFLLFDIEIAFLYPYAMAVRDLRWVGYVQMLVFFLLLLAGYIYIWRKGALDWGKEEP